MEVGREFKIVVFVVWSKTSKSRTPQMAVCRGSEVEF